ncbi:MAG TPA: class I mannose-6-phosphate isomerase, partial [Anaerolineales bacterium]|nr:class I mannose-6-phosphate isomerase [Anaerolineales bacterium]
EYRKTSQPLLPKTHEPRPPGEYEMYPVYSLSAEKIEHGFSHLASHLIGHPQIVIDGYVGVLWGHFRDQLNQALHNQGVKAQWISVAKALRPAAEIQTLIEPFLGWDDPIFGKRFTGTLADFFDPQNLTPEAEGPRSEMVIYYGTGAALVPENAYLVYVDVPKNEIQYCARAGSIHNLGATSSTDPGTMYKRFYFVDWVALNAHKAALLPKMDLYVDEQDPEIPALMAGVALRKALTEMGQSYCRVRPWFEPGPWGGQWMKERIPQLARDVPNYAWSFEMIAPEQGIVLESSGNLLEISFDLLMAHDAQAILGDHADRFGQQFPIRFDFLDTFSGGNLSMQCHPRPSYIREHFGEDFTQDETYYILDTKPDAKVYLGFQQGLDPAEFRLALEDSLQHGTPVEMERFVQVMPSEKHRLFLIPNGTIHCSGTDNLVLEISATPYIFTFKMYDWLRLDLQGKPRPLNIQRAFDNLYFERRGEIVERELVAQPALLEAGEDWQTHHLPTHPSHFYDVHRIEFDTSVSLHTDGSPHLLMLVEGTSIRLETCSGRNQRFNYAETFLVPAAADCYRLINEGTTTAKIVKAYLKPAWKEPGE